MLLHKENFSKYSDQKIWVSRKQFDFFKYLIGALYLYSNCSILANPSLADASNHSISIAQNAIFVCSKQADRGNGSLKSPYASIMRAIDKASDGATIYLRGGTYLEAISVNHEDKSLTLCAYPKEQVVINGAGLLQTDWQDHENGVFKTIVAQPVWQLFANDSYAYRARWPNATFEDGKIWRMTEGMRSLDGGYHNQKPTGKSRLGIAYDDAFKSSSKAGFNEGDSRYTTITQKQSLAETQVDFTGAVAVLNIGHWRTWARHITEHEAGSDYFSYSTNGITVNELRKHTAYYIYGLPALDQVNEWWYDSKTNYLYYKPESTSALDSLILSSRKTDFMIELLRVKNIHFKNLNFFAAGYDIRYCENIIFENCRFDYPSANKYTLGHFDWFNNYNNNTNNALSTFFRGRENKVINCIYSRSNAPIIFDSEQMSIQNCLFEDIEWDVNTNGASGSVMIGKGGSIVHSTLRRTGNSEGIRAFSEGCEIRYNRVYDAGNLQHDGSGINVGTRVQKGTYVTHNWVHDSNRQGVRFDYHGMNFFQDDGSVYGDGQFAFNVIWNTQPSQVKGDRHLISNNTVINCNYYPDPEQEKFNFSVQGFKAMHGIMGNEHSLIVNNLANISHRSWDLRIFDKRTENYKNGAKYFKDLNYNVLPGKHENNMTEAGAAYKYLRDPENYDFRPRLDSPLIHAARTVLVAENPNRYTSLAALYKAESKANIDIGAYQSDQEHYWIPGFRAIHASTPIPKNNAIVRVGRIDLMFLEAYQSSTHHVYFGKSPNSLQLVATLKGSNICSAPKLVSGETYYWRVDSEHKNSISQGPLWSFKVGGDTKKIMHGSDAHLQW